MSRLTAKLAFIHRRLWRRDGAYRAAVVLGPAPLIGAAAAAAVWAGMNASASAPLPPPWARYEPAAAVSAGPPTTLPPGAPLPPTDSTGALQGVKTSWRGTIQPLEVSSALEARVMPSELTLFDLDGPAMDMDQVAAAGPSNQLFVGVGRALLAIRTPGTYAFSARLDRSSPIPANCLVRLLLGQTRIVSNLDLNVVGAVAGTFKPLEFNLQPGTYGIILAAGCWRGQQVVGPGRVTVLIRHPGEQAFQAVQAAELIRPSNGPR